MKLKDLKAEASEKYALGERVQANLIAHRQRAAHVEKGTVSAEQLETAAMANFTGSPTVTFADLEAWESLTEAVRKTWRERTGATLNAAGFYVDRSQR
ncbi:hypothetical protein [Nesterenkonia rhizosphaerae]|uniref:Uncharacterized protein n=1 Tax=Nesterenkonia rhizosphaerae TaxID=1348272 RepID=A0ABP9G6Y1_9MICC